METITQTLEPIPELARARILVPTPVLTPIRVRVREQKIVGSLRWMKMKQKQRRKQVLVTLLRSNSSQQMAKAIQSAYYQEAKNPSLEETLIACAVSIDLDENLSHAIKTATPTSQHSITHL